jgi:hypothetical protein
MQDNLQTLQINDIRKEAYYQIGRHLFYAEELSEDGTMVLLEDCFTLESKWVHVAGLEVRYVNARSGNRRSS